MAYRVEITKPAERDLIGIFSYIADTLKEPGTAKRLYPAIKREVLSLCELPERYAILDEPPYNEAGVRRMPVENYLVFYLIRGETVHVLRILYKRREWQALLSPELRRLLSQSNAGGSPTWETP